MKDMYTNIVKHQTELKACSRASVTREKKEACQGSPQAVSSDEVQWSVESPFPVHVLPKILYRKTHYITVTLATLTDYIILHQSQRKELHTETPAEVIGYSGST